MEPWIVVFWICGGLSASLFVLQSVFWTAMRMRKLPVDRWRRWARRIRFTGIALLVAGAGMWFTGPDARPAAMIALFGGGLNALVAAFHLAVVTYLTRPPGGE